MNLFKGLELRKQDWDFADVASQSLGHKNGEIDKTHLYKSDSTVECRQSTIARIIFCK